MWARGITRGLGTDHSLKHQVYKAIKDDIIFGRLRSGEQLNMLELCNRMHISSAPIREALNMLSKEGLVDLTPQQTGGGGHCSGWGYRYDYLPAQYA